MRSPEDKLWEEAMIEELQSHEANGTWELTELPEIQRILDNKIPSTIEDPSTLMCIFTHLEKVEQGVLKLEYVPSSEQTADISTKPLTNTLFINLHDGLGLAKNLGSS
ncbi:hypothetical protein AVEN_149744-1 [Araneus ventricosus]|uniref:Uncharacterized protein n=1 Tax=Araneus ventricosus TaxID=182803 RepID=A0A4Y2TIE9_ARAVE|nr:hypothetical protein AVEN_149744-1 [Araneus ventricosus]